ncbi:SDR family NAD(P)-dependent oxidoreductase [Novosphingobium album (ex Liu et al. 2023)]|uniref:SDR family oxidoreductase n=1 Tax=Novosphingobium album (ex Liu et al. 2023) TaxID=3031130 RepID=A0ABT5WXE5_9SPHN|nr:SDR family oxidoreductase [Novosphingobium album (ex Liu et al. 2023)]MDE8654567.1 SDR family oxidoreductase [Novosphingobium album (ex Liu et al. 2023)]
MRLEGRVAFVTGSSRGIGAAIARRLAADGARLVLHARAGRDRADAVAQVIRADGGEAHVLLGDLTEGETASDLVGRAFAIHGALDMLVLNAGGGKGGLAVDQSVAAIDSVIALNLRATILAASAFARLSESDQGRIVFISSGMATHPAPGVAVGAAAKAGAEAFIRCLAQELGPRGITCNSVAPGCTCTEMIAGQAWPEAVPPWTALRRLGEPEDIADVVAFLASHEARWLTGLTIAANGGLVTTAANILARAG